MTDRFQTLSTISSHGNVTLFRGWDSSQSRDVVIERIRLPQEIAQGFTRYARLLYGLRDPNLVRVLDFGADTEGAYLVMEALKGKTLEATVAAHALDMAAFRALVQQTLHGLAAAHESGLLHLQLRPEKIIMPWGSGDSAQIKITGFSLGLVSGTVTPHTQTSEAYLAPEQRAGFPTDPRTDLYALGAIFYYALTQRLPVRGKTSHEPDAEGAVQALTPLAELRHDLPSSICIWVERLMSLRMDERPASVAEALTMFSMLDEDEPAAAVIADEEEELAAVPLMEEEPVLEQEPLIEQESIFEEQPAAALLEQHAVSAAEDEAASPVPPDSEQPIAAAADLVPEEALAAAPILSPEMAEAHPEPEEQKVSQPEPAAPTPVPVSPRGAAAAKRATAPVPAQDLPQPPPPRGPRFGAPGVGLIIGAFAALAVAMLGLVSYLKYSQRQERQQRLNELAATQSPQGSDLDVRLLLESLDDPQTRDTAARVLSDLRGGDYIDTMLVDRLREIRDFSGAAKLTEVIGNRGIQAAFDEVAPLIEDHRLEVREAAWSALGNITEAEDLPRLLNALDKAPSREREWAEQALISAVTSAADQAKATKAVMQAYRSTDRDPAIRTLLFNVLTRVGGPETKEVVIAAIADPAQDVRLAAIMVLAEYPTHELLPAITARFAEETDPSCRAYLALAAAELVNKPGPLTQEALALHAQSLYANANTPSEKQRALTAVGRVIAPATATFYQNFADSADTELRQEARQLARAFRDRLARVVQVQPGNEKTVVPVDVADAKSDGQLKFLDGKLFNWVEEGDWASWLVQMPNSGKYEVMVYQANEGASQGTYEVLLAGQTLLTTAVNTGGRSNYKGFIIGEVQISEPGTYRLTMRAKKIPPGEELLVLQHLAIKPLQ